MLVSYTTFPLTGLSINPFGGSDPAVKSEGLLEHDVTGLPVRGRVVALPVTPPSI
jgi:hypothetical protein